MRIRLMIRRLGGVVPLVASLLTGAAAHAEPLVRYVAPDGSGDGTSWANASASLADMYAAVGANADGGAVYVKSGSYALSAPITMLPNVTVEGGHGGETVLTGDTIGSNCWRLNNAGTSVGLIWNSGVFTAPAPTAADDVWTPYDPDRTTASRDTDYAFVCTNTAAANAVFRSLTFTGFRYAAVYASSGQTDGLKIDKCRVLANNTQATDATSVSHGAVLVSGAPAEVTDTVFIGNVFALRFQSSDRVVTNLVRGCTFFGNAGLRQGSLHGGAGGLEAAGCAMMDVYDSTFERNCGWMGNAWGNNDGPGGLAFYNGGADGHVSFVSNCVFRGNFTKNIYSYAGAMQLRHGSSNTVVLLDCSFTGNRWNLSGNIRGSACICSGAESASCGPLFARNCYFAGNVMSNAITTATGYYQSSVWTDTFGARATFLNCTFERNVSVSQATSSDRNGTFGAGSAQHLVLINCTLLDNDVYAAGARAADFQIANVWNSSDFVLLNTVAWHSADDYVSLPATNTFTNKKGCILGSCAIKNNTWNYDYRAEGSVTDLGFNLGNFNGDDPFLATSSKTRGSVTARGIRADSPWRKTGLSVWIATDYRSFIYTTTPPASAAKPWVVLTSHQTKLTPAEAAAIGVSLDAPLPPDAFGNARVAGKIAIGTLNPPASGFQMMVR